MNPIFDEIDLEKFIHSAFGLKLEIKSTLANKIPIGAASVATIFLTDKGLLFALLAAHGSLSFGDVRKILMRMNLRAEQFMPPHADANYFDRIATAKFREVFPGRVVANDNDLVFYKTLASYNPALVQIAEVTDGIIKQYDTDAVGHWRPSLKFSYRRIRTS